MLVAPHTLLVAAVHGTVSAEQTSHRHIVNCRRFVHKTRLGVGQHLSNLSLTSAARLQNTSCNRRDPAAAESSGAHGLSLMFERCAACIFPWLLVNRDGGEERQRRRLRSDLAPGHQMNAVAIIHC